MPSGLPTEAPPEDEGATPPTRDPPLFGPLRPSEGALRVLSHVQADTRVQGPCERGLRARGGGGGEARLGCPGEAAGRAAAILPAGPAAAAARLTLAAAQRRSACVRPAAVTSSCPAGSPVPRREGKKKKPLGRGSIPAWRAKKKKRAPPSMRDYLPRVLTGA